MKKLTRLMFVVVLATIGQMAWAQTTELFISEYAEGSGSNKYYEIYNGTGADVDLTPYVVKLASNGGDWGNTEDFTGTLADGDVLVVANSSSDPAILAVADVISSTTWFNGNDALGLFNNDVLIDVIGVQGEDPGSGWPVAGVSNGTQEHTIVRKSSVCSPTTDWAASAGTSAADSQWEVYGQNDWSYIDAHTANCSGGASAPSAITGDATNISNGVATLNGTVSANGAEATITFEYGETDTYGTTVNANPNTTTGNNTPVSYDATGLTNGTTYHYRVVAVNSEGTSNGSDKTFVPFADIINEEGFDNDLGSWSQYSVTGDQIWAQDSYGSATYAKMSGYSGGNNENEDWLISPALNFDNYDNEFMWFETAMNYSGPDLALKVSTDYSGSGDPNAATWTDLTSSAAWSGGGWAWQHSGVVDLSTFNGTVYVAFMYTSTTSGSATWEVDGIFISGEAQALPTAARIVGSMNSWSTTDPDYVMTMNANGCYELVKTLGAGEHQYKLLEGDDWSQPNYPGNNQVFLVGANEEITWKGNIDADLVFHGMPAVAGSFFEAMGQGNNWDPSNPAGDMVDPEGDDVYTWTGVVPQGNWEFKVTFNENWDQSTGGNVGFTSNGVDETTMTYTFATNTTEVTGPPPPTAPVTFTVDDSQNQFFTGFFLKGSWDANGQYDPSWGGGMEHSMLYDDGTNGDVTAGDHIWTVTLDLIVDGGSNTWAWGVNNVDHEWITGGPEFQVATEDPVATAIVFPGVPDLLITEIMYNGPESGTDSTEFVEIYNNGSVDVNMAGYKILDGFEVYFPDMVLAAGEYVVAAVDSMAMVSLFGYEGAIQTVSGGLSNGGETITLLNNFNTPVNGLTYDDNAPWPTEPDGDGPSLRFCDFTLDNTMGENWSASVMLAGTNTAGDPIYATPGSGCIFPITDLVITEVMYDSPEVGLDVLEFIEIQNIGDEAIDLEGVHFSKGIEYTFPSMILEPENYVVVCADAAAFQLNFGIDAMEWTAGWLEDTGEEIEITDSNGFVVDYFEYENESPWPLNAAGLGSSMTLCDPLTDNSDPYNWSDSDEFLAVSYFGDTIWATPYGGCVYPIPELVITEINYNGPEGGSDTTEFVEIYNASMVAVDMEGIYFSAGFEYTFPAITMQPQEYLIVSVNAQAMQNTFGVTSYQWTNGGLSNGGEDIELRDIHDQVIDYVDYDDALPWDTLADGFGPSLTFCNPTLDNSLAENWMASQEFAAINANNDTIWATPGTGCMNLDPIANFEADQTVIDMGDAVNFTDLSTGEPTTWAWTFNGATPETSAEQHPAGVVYPNPGQFDVTLTVTNEYGESTETKAMYITVNDTASAPVADFEASQTTIPVGSSIDFTDLSLNNPTSWEWNFDGATPATSNSQNPTGIQYTAVGTFTVSLTATNDIGSSTETKTEYITVVDTTAYDIVITEIMYNPPESGNDSLEFVEIYNNESVAVDLEGYYFSSGVVYEFLEGTIEAGEYKVIAINAEAIMNTFGVEALQWTEGALSNGGEVIELRNSGDAVVDIVAYEDTEPWPVAADGDGPSMTLCDPTDDNNMGENWWASLEFAAINADNDTIWATPGAGCSVYPSYPIANFEANITSLIGSGSVMFTDLSTGNPTNWEWTFEGGTPATSSEQNPTISYNIAGDFDVTLTAWNDFGTDTKTKTDYIHVGVGISDDLQFVVMVYPNPTTTGIFNIASNNETMKEIRIYNIAGGIVYENNSSVNTIAVDLSNNSKGVYFLHLTDVESGNTIVKKLIVK